MAVLKDADGNEVSGDLNSTVGTGGSYYVTVGDSITNGTGDDDDTNNETLDGRIIARQGFQAPLADLLTAAATGRPQIVFNEGIGSETAALLLLRIDSILERHPKATGFLLMIGTNDSFSVSADSYKTSVEETASKIDITGKTVWLAQVMPRYEDDIDWILHEPMNSLIRAYNTSLREIALSSSTDRTRLGPNFYQDFLVYSPAEVYADRVHPSDAGYQLMAEKWLETLIP
jgi:lysophospholipase L1-like esterase